MCWHRGALPGLAVLFGGGMLLADDTYPHVNVATVFVIDAKWPIRIAPSPAPCGPQPTSAPARIATIESEARIPPLLRLRSVVPRTPARGQGR